MLRWIPICRVEEIQVNGVLYAECDGRALAVVRVLRSEDSSSAARGERSTSTGELGRADEPSESGATELIFILNDRCPHAGASLANGHVVDNCLVCPQHAWHFRLADGRCPDNLSIRVDRFPCRVEDGMVHLGSDDADD